MGANLRIKLTRLRVPQQDSEVAELYPSILSMNTLWLLLDLSLARVLAQARFFLAFLMIVSIWSSVRTSSSLRLVTWMSVPLALLILISCLRVESFCNKSLISSL